MTTATAFFIVPSNIQIHKLQRVQNMTARLVSNSSCYRHIMPVLQELSWLRGYIQDHWWTGTYLYHEFRFSEEEISIPLEFRQVVVVSSTFLRRTCWETAFSVASPTLRNVLLLNIRHETNILKFKKDRLSRKRH